MSEYFPDLQIIVSADAEAYLNIGRVLISAGADVNLQDNDGWTALSVAIIKGNTNIALKLIDAGTDVHAQRRSSSGHSLLMYAAGSGNKEVASALVKAGADVNAQDEDGWIALMMSAEVGNDEVASAACALPPPSAAFSWTAGSPLAHSAGAGLFAATTAFGRGECPAVRAYVRKNILKVRNARLDSRLPQVHGANARLLHFARGR